MTLFTRGLNTRPPTNTHRTDWEERDGRGKEGYGVEVE